MYTPGSESYTANCMVYMGLMMVVVVFYGGKGGRANRSISCISALQSRLNLGA